MSKRGAGCQVTAAAVRSDCPLAGQVNKSPEAKWRGIAVALPHDLRLSYLSVPVENHPFTVPLTVFRTTAPICLHSCFSVGLMVCDLIVKTGFRDYYFWLRHEVGASKAMGEERIHLP